MEEHLWTEQDVADFLKIPAGTVKRWRRDRKGPPYTKLGRHIRYDPAEVRNWWRQQERKQGG